MIVIKAKSEDRHVNTTAIETAQCRMACGFKCKNGNLPVIDKFKEYLKKENRNFRPSKLSLWLIKARTVAFDEYIQDLVDKDRIDGVLNIGAGLDFRFLNLKLPGDFRWIDCDFGKVVKIKEDLLATTKLDVKYSLCNLDITNPTEINKIMQNEDRMKRFLVLSEGVLCYLAEGKVMELTSILSDQNKILYWTFDLNSPWAIEHMSKKQKSQYNQKEFSIKFAPKEGCNFFKDYPWSITQENTLRQIASKNDIPIPQPWAFLLKITKVEEREKFNNACRIILMEKE